MSKFHINKHGVPAPCKAEKGKCPLGGNSGQDNHFNSLEEAQESIDKENEKEYELMPNISEKADKDENVNSTIKEKKLTPAQIRTQKKKAHEAEVAKRLGNYWKKRDGTPDEKMVKFCLKDSKYIQIGDAMVDVADAKPTINSEMWYDDETKSPQVNFESFHRYNVQMNMPNYYEKTGKSSYGSGTLKIVPQYDGAKDFELAALTYDDEPNSDYVEVTDEQLEQINAGIKEVREDYEKRLKSYYKRYEDKITARGYWKNR